MKYYRFPDNWFVKACFPLVLLVLQMVARSTMYSSTFLGFGKAQAIMIAVVLLVGLAFLAVNRKHWKQILTDRRMLLFGASVVLVLGPMLLKQDWQLMYFSILLCWLFAVFLTYFTTTQELGKWYVIIMACLSVYAVVGQFVLKPMVHAGLLPGNPFDSPGGWHMFNFGLTFPCDKNNHMDDALRVFGIFREPGMFQIVLFVAIALNDHVLTWDKSWKQWVMDGIFFVTMVTTFATGGVLALGLYIFFLFFDRGLHHSRTMRLLLAALVVGVIAFVVYELNRGGSWAYELVGMVQKIYLMDDSFTARTESIVADARFFFSSPLWGADLAEVMYSVPNNTTTSPILFAVFGIAGGIVHVLSWAALVWKKERHLLLNLMVMVIFFVPFNTQNVLADMFFWLFPLMALSEKCLMLMENNPRKKRAC